MFRHILFPTDRSLASLRPNKMRMTSLHAAQAYGA